MRDFSCVTVILQKRLRDFYVIPQCLEELAWILCSAIVALEVGKRLICQIDYMLVAIFLGSVTRAVQKLSSFWLVGTFGTS